MIRSKQNLLDIHPLTPVQQGILVRALASDDDPYLLRMCFRITGPVDAAALQRAWQAAVDRHEALRADLEWTKADRPVMLVFRRAPAQIEAVDWHVAAGEPRAAIDARLRAVAAEEARRFTLQRAADHRLVLVRTAPDEHFLLWVFHHALIDGWSIANLFSDLLRGYRAAVAGAPDDAAPPPGHASYLAWLAARPTADAEAYWRDTLAGHDPVEFPPRGTDLFHSAATERRPSAAAAPRSDGEGIADVRGAGPTAASAGGDRIEAGAHATRGTGAERTRATGYAERSIVLDDETSARLRARAAEARVTLATCLAAAHALLVRAWTGAADVAFGATIAGRPGELAGADAMVGAFINTVPLRVRVPDTGRVADWLARLHRDAGRRVDFEHLGLPRILELAAPPSGRPLFESILVFESFPVSHVIEQADALPFGVEHHPLFDEAAGVVEGRGRNHYPLTLVVLPGRRIELIVAYHRDRVGDATATALTDRLAAIVRALAACDAMPAVLDAGAPRPARRAPPAAAPRAIHARIAHWADATPGAIAVRCEAAALTYAELDARADRLAHRLRAAGAAPGSRIGVCLPRSPEFVVALYAALKLGAAYVALDPEAPCARLAGLIDDARLAAVVTRGSALAGLHPWLVRCDDPAADRAPATPIHTSVHPEAPAYIIYTSGSTGAPKGVVISHRALDRYVTSIAERLTPAATASMAMVSTVAADLGHTSLFGALCAGGTLHLISDERAADPDAFADAMARHQVAALKIVPGHLWGLMQTAAPDRALPSHTLVLGGESAPPALLAHLRAQTRCRVINHYGPTETTVGVLTHALDAGPLPLGTPLPHAHAHVLGPDLRPLPAGAPGEIFLGGAALAAGYFRRPALTAERFVPDPYAGEPGARLYRTGDRGRVRDDGAIEFLGRIDDQVKLRGFRIEPAEIRAELLRQPGVADARVVARSGPAGSLQLCAYLIGTPGSGDLAAALRARLPEPMVPSAFVWLDRFPVTANGKLDVARLPDPAARPAGATPTAGGAPASNAAERALAAIWRDVLGCDEVGRDDSFFDLGGDSILALKVVARARRAGYKLTPKQLFAHPTLAAAALAAQPIDPVASPTTAAQPTAAPPTAPSVAATGQPGAVAPTAGQPHGILLTPIQLHFLARAERDPHHFNQAILLALDAPVALDRLAAAIHQLTCHHDALRLRFHRDGDRWRATLADPAAAPGDAVTRVDLGGAAASAASAAAAIERACDELQRGFDLSRGPLLRAAYLDLGPARPPRLLLCAHHLVVDGVSWRILLEDLAELMRPAPAALPPVATSFAAWTERLHAYSRGPELAAELAYWQREAPARAAAPPGPGDNTAGDAAIASGALDAATTAALLRAPRALGASLHEVLLAALADLLCRAWDRPSLDVTVEGHGREDLFDGVDVSRTVGWFATTYPVRLTPAASPAATVRAVADELRRVPARGIGHGLLRHVAPGAPLAAAPAPDITFNYLGQFDDGPGAFEIASESSGRRKSPHAPRDSWHVVNAVIYDGTLRVAWEHHRTRHDRAAVERLLEDYLAALRALVHGGSP